MRCTTKRGIGFVEADMTPMIDLTFQLIAFFMVVVSFSEANQDERIKLPSSELAKPPDTPLEIPITLQLTSGETERVIFGSHEVAIGEIRPLLLVEMQLLRRRGDASAREATVIIRADRLAKTGRVQELIKICQEVGFEKFALRAMYEASSS